MLWRCLGRLSALVVLGVVAGPAWAEPYLRVAQSAESPAAPSEPPAQSTPDGPTGDASAAAQSRVTSGVARRGAPASERRRARDHHRKAVAAGRRQGTGEAPHHARAGRPGRPASARGIRGGSECHRRGRIRLGPGRWLYRHAERDRHQDRHADPRDAARHLGGGPGADPGAGRAVGRGGADLYVRACAPRSTASIPSTAASSFAASTCRRSTDSIATA